MRQQQIGAECDAYTILIILKYLIAEGVYLDEEIVPTYVDSLCCWTLDSWSLGNWNFCFSLPCCALVFSKLGTMTKPCLLGRCSVWNPRQVAGIVFDLSFACTSLTLLVEVGGSTMRCFKVQLRAIENFSFCFKISCSEKKNGRDQVHLICTLVKHLIITRSTIMQLCNLFAFERPVGITISLCIWVSSPNLSLLWNIMPVSWWASKPGLWVTGALAQGCILSK